MGPAGRCVNDKANLLSECKEEMEEDIASSLSSKKIDEG